MSALFTKLNYKVLQIMWRVTRAIESPLLLSLRRVNEYRNFHFRFPATSYVIIIRRNRFHAVLMRLVADCVGDKFHSAYSQLLQSVVCKVAASYVLAAGKLPRNRRIRATMKDQFPGNRTGSRSSLPPPRDANDVISLHPSSSTETLERCRREAVGFFSSSLTPLTS